MPHIKLLTFDLDNTLWDVEAIVEKAERDMMLWLHENFPQLTAQFDAKGLRAVRREVAEAHPEIVHDLTQLRTATLKLGLQKSGYSEAESNDGSKAAFEVFYQGRNTVTYFPNVVETLEILAKEFTIYALSNGNADTKRIGLGHIFSEHFSAASVGKPKPAPDMYLKALETAGVSGAEAIHIGDHHEQDIAAARNVGMHTIWVNYAKAEWPDAEPFSGQINAFDELPAVIEHIKNRA